MSNNFDFVMIQTKDVGTISVPKNLKIFSREDKSPCEARPTTDETWTDVHTFLANELSDLITSAKSGHGYLRLGIVGLDDPRKNHVIWREVNPKDTRVNLVKKLFMSQGYTFQYIQLGLPDCDGMNPICNCDGMNPICKDRPTKTYEIVMW